MHCLAQRATEFLNSRPLLYVFFSLLQLSVHLFLSFLRLKVDFTYIWIRYQVPITIFNVYSVAQRFFFLCASLSISLCVSFFLFNWTIWHTHTQSHIFWLTVDLLTSLLSLLNRNKSWFLLIIAFYCTFCVVYFFFLCQKQ